jgi:hypothetical protein
MDNLSKRLKPLNHISNINKFLDIMIGFLFVNNLFRPKTYEGKNKD